MREITLEELLQAGCHFGHQVNRRNPKADDFIFEARSGVNIIDLGKTREGLVKAGEYIRTLASTGGSFVIVGTKRQAAPIVQSEVERARKEGAKNIYYITSRWIGGVLTNFSEVSKNFKKVEDIEKILNSNSTDYTKREKLEFSREKEKLLTLYGGVLGLEGTPDAIFIVDTHLEKTAVNEGRKMEVTLVGITDTNSDPSLINYPIPANDDAVGSIQLIVNYIVDAYVEGTKSGIKNQESGIKEEKGSEAQANKDEKAEKAAELQSSKAAQESSRKESVSQNSKAAKTSSEEKVAKKETKEESLAPKKIAAKKAKA